MVECWLDIVGVTARGTRYLPADRQALLEAAEIIVGSPRLLADICVAGKRLVPWQSPAARMIEQVLSFRGMRAVILATGDPSWFGIASTLASRLDKGEYVIHPAPSAFSLAAARMKWPLQNTCCISVHGRPTDYLQRFILPGQRILSLTSDAASVARIAALLVRRGFGNSAMTVLCSMGGEAESRIEFTANTGPSGDIDDLNTVAITCFADENVLPLAPLPGLVDSAFVSDGQLTKREVRAATLAKLIPLPGQRLWDVGAGCGSVAIEWMRAAHHAPAICFEKNPSRIGLIEQNRAQLGVPDLVIVGGNAPDSFVNAAPPDAVFIGGDVASRPVFDACWNALKPGGRLVANAVTLDGETALFQRLQQHGGDMTRLAISHLDKVATHHTFRPRMTVTQWHVTKPVGGTA